MGDGCRVHCIANGLLGNSLDVIISSMVYAKSTGCNVSISVGYSKKGWRSVWDEMWVLKHVHIEANSFVHQLAQPPSDLPYVCPLRWSQLEACNHSSTSPSGLPIFDGRGVAFSAFAAFMPPVMTRNRFLKSYFAMARILRLKTSVSGPYHNQSYYHPCLPVGTVALHLRTGRTTFDMRCCNSVKKCKQAGTTPCSFTNESRFDIPIARLKAATEWAAAQQDASDQLFVAFDDKTLATDVAYSGYSTLEMLRDEFPHAWYSSSAARALWSFEDHRLLATSAAIVTYEYSSFSWTAAQMGGVPYYVVNCSAKCMRYVCSGCTDPVAGVKPVTEQLRSVPGELRTGQPGDRRKPPHGARNRRNAPVLGAVEPRDLPWQQHGCGVHILSETAARLR